MPVPKRGSIWEDSGCFLMARILGNDGNAITQASVSSISYVIHNITSDVAVTSGSLTVSDVVFDTLQTDDRWTADDTGYNFGHAALASWFATPDVTYRVEYKFTPTSGQVFFAVFEVTSNALYTS